MAKNENNKNRRQFLKNISLGTIGLGLSPLMGEAKPNKINKIASCDPTTLDYYGEGPFYTENPPILVNNKLAKDTEPGQPIRISGRVLNKDCTQHIPNATIDIWHANDAGQYDNAGFKLRGKVLSNSEGYYLFETVKPGKYLNGSKYRPSHIHFKISAPGFAELTTQLYFEGDTSISEDAAASITSGQYNASHRIISLIDDGNGVLEGTWDIVIDANGVNGINDLHLNRGMIYEANPNPFSEKLIIKYGVLRNADTSLMVFDLHGRKVAQLEHKRLNSAKYEASWVPPAGLPSGHYFIALKVNDIQVHYLKVQYMRR